MYKYQILRSNLRHDVVTLAFYQKHEKLLFWFSSLSSRQLNLNPTCESDLLQHVMSSSSVQQVSWKSEPPPPHTHTAFSYPNTVHYSPITPSFLPVPSPWASSPGGSVWSPGCWLRWTAAGILVYSGSVQTTDSSRSPGNTLHATRQCQTRKTPSSRSD